MRGSSYGEVGESVAVDSSDNIYVCGSTSSVGAGSNDLLLVKYNSSGTVQWRRTLGGTGSDEGKELLLTVQIISTFVELLVQHLTELGI